MTRDELITFKGYTQATDKEPKVVAEIATNEGVQLFVNALHGLYARVVVTFGSYMVEMERPKEQ